MLCGKSTLGKKLAARLGYEFLDTDTEIENKYRISVEGIFAKYGEQTFRLFERRLLESLEERDNIVVSTGGGMPCFGRNMQRIKSLGYTIYLYMPPEAIVARYGVSHRRRPILERVKEEERLDFVRRSLAERELYYRQADLVTPSIGLKVEEIVGRLAQ